MIIRKINKQDKEKWIKLVKEADRRDKTWAEQKFNSYVQSKKKRRLLVVEEKAKLIGFAGIKGEDIEEKVSKELTEESILITWIAFVPEFRNKGLGSKLLAECEKYALKWSKKVVWLGCRDEVIPFYEKNLYRKAGRFVNEKGKEENLMVKKF